MNPQVDTPGIHISASAMIDNARWAKWIWRQQYNTTLIHLPFKHTLETVPPLCCPKPEPNQATAY